MENQPKVYMGPAASQPVLFSMLPKSRTPWSEFLLSYGVVGPDNRIDVNVRWDHRITDAVVIARALTRMEQVLNTEIAAELQGQLAEKCRPL